MDDKYKSISILSMNAWLQTPNISLENSMISDSSLMSDADSYISKNDKLILDSGLDNLRFTASTNSVPRKRYGKQRLSHISLNNPIDKDLDDFDRNIFRGNELDRNESLAEEFNTSSNESVTEELVKTNVSKLRSKNILKSSLRFGDGGATSTTPEKFHSNPTVLGNNNRANCGIDASEELKSFEGTLDIILPDNSLGGTLSPIAKQDVKIKKKGIILPGIPLRNSTDQNVKVADSSIKAKDANFETIALNLKSFQKFKSVLKNKRRNLTESVDMASSIAPVTCPQVAEVKVFQYRDIWVLIINALKLSMPLMNQAKEKMNQKLKDIGYTSYVCHEEQIGLSEAFQTKQITRIQELIKIPLEKRTDQNFEEIDKILLFRIKDYSALSDDERYQFYYTMKLERHPKGTVLFWEDHVVTNIYIVLIGDIENVKINQGKKLSLGILSGGQILGMLDARVQWLGMKRNSCWIFTKDAMVLSLNIEESRLNLANAHIYRKSKVLQNYEPFLSNDKLFQCLLPFFRLVEYNQNDIIQEQGKAVDNFVWILTGSCCITYKVPFMAKKSKGVTISLVPCSSNTAEDATAEIIEKEFETQKDIKLGEWIPYIVDPAVKVFEKSEIEENLKSCKFTVKCDTSILAVKISSKELLECLKLPAILEIAKTSTAKHYGMEAMQKEYLETRAWENYKKNVGNYVGFNKAKK